MLYLIMFLNVFLSGGQRWHPAGCAAGGGCGIPAPCSVDGQITATGKRALWREGGVELAGEDLWYLVR